MLGVVGMLVIALYCTCGVIRPAQFNVMADERLGKEEEVFHYRGLPITFVSVVLREEKNDC